MFGLGKIHHHILKEAGVSLLRALSVPAVPGASAMARPAPTISLGTTDF
jgi:hypothetical protein